MFYAIRQIFKALSRIQISHQRTVSVQRHTLPLIRIQDATTNLKNNQQDLQ